MSWLRSRVDFDHRWSKNIGQKIGHPKRWSKLFSAVVKKRKVGQCRFFKTKCYNLNTLMKNNL